MEQFGNFQFGKIRLLELRSYSEASSRLDSDLDPRNIEHTIRSNREVRERYSDLINQIELFFKDRIRGNA